MNAKNTSPTTFRHGFLKPALLLGLSAALLPPAHAVLTDITLGQVLQAGSQPANIALALSVEFPTVGSPYRTDSYFNPDKTYIGYWDHQGCYRYKGETHFPFGEDQYFYRNSTVDPTTKECNKGSDKDEYSGNLLNFAATSSIDVLRLAMTGGHREVDTTDTTILARAFLYNGWQTNSGSSNFPARKIKREHLGKYLPAAPAKITVTDDIFVSNCKNVIMFGTRSGNHGCEYGRNYKASLQKADNSWEDATGHMWDVYWCQNNRAAWYPASKACKVEFTQYVINAEYDLRNLNPQSKPGQDFSSGNAPGDINTFLPLYARVKVCDTSAENDPVNGTRKDLCRKYGEHFKPIGEIQKNGEKAKISAFGYLANNERSEDGKHSVMRAAGAFLGPTKFDGTANPEAEWEAATGIFKTNPRNASGPTASDGQIYSGTINYLNRFGTTGVLGYYKTFDAIGNLYYEALRYFMGKQPLAATLSYLDNKLAREGQGILDGYPVIRTWDDPIASKCNLDNYILAIGDSNSWEVERLADEPMRIPDGGTAENFTPQTYLNEIKDWNTAKSWATCHSYDGAYTGTLYYRCDWAGAAYGAFTRPIRKDMASDNTGSLDSIRVKTFTIDVDEGGSATVDRRSYFQAAKYGWFNDNNNNGKPDPGEWETAGSSPASPEYYVQASQADKMMSGIKKFFEAANNPTGGVFSVDYTNTRFSPTLTSGGMFLPVQDQTDWSGTVRRLKINYDQEHKTFAAGEVIWDAGLILTDSTKTGHVTAANRKLFTWSRDDKEGTEFKADKLDAAVIASLKKDSANGADEKHLERINWLRGDRSNEETLLRKRNSVMGDVLNGTPVFKKGFDEIIDSTYATFKSANKTRPGVVYVGANDGMMHAFNAESGQELFAYIPRAVSEKLYLLTRSAYLTNHRPYVDATPEVAEAKIGTNWKTILASGMGGGAKGVFALDVTDPANFDDDKVLFEFTNIDDPDMGNVTTPPRIIMLRKPGAGETPEFAWYLAVSSGYNNYKDDGYNKDDNSASFSNDGAQALFLLSLDKAVSDTWTLNSNYFKIKLPAPLGTVTQAGLANPGYVQGYYGEARILYAGDLQGNLWRFDLRTGINEANVAAAVQTNASNTYIPLAKVGQPITTSPVITAGADSGYMVLFGTGKYMEMADVTAGMSVTNAIYGIWDKLSTAAADYELSSNQFYQRSFGALTGGVRNISNGKLFTFGSGGVCNSTSNPDDSTCRGWQVVLPSAGERVIANGALAASFVAFNSVKPGGNICAGTGSSATLCLDPLYGTQNNGCEYRPFTGFIGTPTIMLLDLADYTYSKRSSTGRRTLQISETTLSPGGTPKSNTIGTNQGTTATPPQISVGRVGWREIKDFIQH